jgi:prepilin-type N-terminal cleavage/methylation domain-containing protein
MTNRSPQNPETKFGSTETKKGKPKMNKYMSDLLRKRQNNEDGFTLVELLIVIIILGVLAAVVVFSVAGVTASGKKAACKANVSTLASASEAFRAQTGAYAADIPAIQAGGFLNNLGGTLAVGGPAAVADTALKFGPAAAPNYTVTYYPAGDALATPPIPLGGVAASNANCDTLTS